MNVVCPNCWVTNRVPDQRIAHDPRCGRCHERLLADEPVRLTEETFARFTERSDLPVVVDFWADWCGPCKMMAPEFAKASAEFASRIRFAKVDTERNPGLANRFGIRSIPTLILLVHGREKDRVSGALSAAQISAWLAAGKP